MGMVLGSTALVDLVFVGLAPVHLVSVALALVEVNLVDVAEDVSAGAR